MFRSHCLRSCANIHCTFLLSERVQLRLGPYLLYVSQGVRSWRRNLTCIFSQILNIIGGIILFKYGQFFFFSFYPEWWEWMWLRDMSDVDLILRSLFGGVAILGAAVAFINIVALSSRSYLFTRVCNFVWPFAFVIAAIGDIALIIELQRG